MVTVMANDAQWQQIDPSTLAPELQASYASYVAARREAGKLKAQFERDMNEHAELPAGLRMVFGYNFGKLSAAVVADDKPQAKPKAPTLSLAAFLRRQVASGHRA
jgi:hypothetical protein